jgi:hypothetical protein
MRKRYGQKQALTPYTLNIVLEILSRGIFSALFSLSLSLSLDVVSVVFVLVRRNESAFLETSVVVVVLVLVFLYFFFLLFLLFCNIIVGKNRTRKTTAETRTKNGRDE